MPNKIKIKQIEGLREELDDLGKEIFLYTENVVWVSKSGNDGTGTVGRFDLPFLTVNAAEDAATEEGVTVSGAGSTSANLTYDYHGSFTNGKRSYTNGSFTVEWNDSLARWEIKSGSSTLYISTSDTTYPWEATVWSANDGDSPAPTVSQRIGSTIVVFPGDYRDESVGIGDALPGKDGVNLVFLNGALSPGFSVSSAVSFVINGNMSSPIMVSNSNADVTVNGDIIGFARCLSGVLKLNGNNLTLNSSASLGGLTATTPLLLSSSGNISASGIRIVSNYPDGDVCYIGDSASGSLKIFNSRLESTNAGTDGATIGIQYGTDVIGTVQLDGVIIETAQDGTGTAKSIDSPSEQTVTIIGSLSATHDVDENIILSGGDFIIDEDIKA